MAESALPLGEGGVSQYVLAVDGLVKRFVAKRSAFGRPLSTVKAVDGVSFVLRPGETLALVGEFGCGKSTVGRLVMRLIEPTAGRIVLDGDDVTALSETAFRPLRRKVQLIFQDPFASLNPRMTVGQILAEPLDAARHGAGGRAQAARRRAPRDGRPRAVLCRGATRTSSPAGSASASSSPGRLRSSRRSMVTSMVEPSTSVT